MGLISKIDAAIKLGIGVELIDYFTNKCPKRGEDIILEAVKTDMGIMFDEDSLIKYKNYHCCPVNIIIISYGYENTTAPTCNFCKILSSNSSAANSFLAQSKRYQ